MRQVLFTALAVVMTATTNFVFAQSNDVVVVHDEGQKTLEITYICENPQYISFHLVGGKRVEVGLYGQTSNVSNGDGTCSASYDIKKLLDSPSGEVFSDAYEKCEKIYVYKKSNTGEEELLFEVKSDDFTK